MLTDQAKACEQSLVLGAKAFEVGGKPRVELLFGQVERRLGGGEFDIQFFESLIAGLEVVIGDFHILDDLAAGLGFGHFGLAELGPGLSHIGLDQSGGEDGEVGDEQGVPVAVGGEISAGEERIHIDRQRGVVLPDGSVDGISGCGDGDDGGGQVLAGILRHGLELLQRGHFLGDLHRVDQGAFLHWSAHKKRQDGSAIQDVIFRIEQKDAGVGRLRFALGHIQQLDPADFQLGLHIADAFILEGQGISQHFDRGFGADDLVVDAGHIQQQGRLGIQQQGAELLGGEACGVEVIHVTEPVEQVHASHQRHGTLEGGRGAAADGSGGDEVDGGQETCSGAIAVDQGLEVFLALEAEAFIELVGQFQRPLEGQGLAGVEGGDFAVGADDTAVGGDFLGLIDGTACNDCACDGQTQQHDAPTPHPSPQTAHRELSFCRPWRDSRQDSEDHGMLARWRRGFYTRSATKPTRSYCKVSLQRVKGNANASVIMQSDMASRHNLLIRMAVGVIGASLLAIGCAEKPQSKGKTEAKPPAAVAVTTQPVRRGEVQRTVDVPGTLLGDEETSISAKVTGRVVAVYKDVGDRVQAGDVLAQIDRIDYQLQVNQKELAMREALAKLGLSDFPAADFDLSQVPMVQRAKFQLENTESKLKRGEQLHDQKPPLLSDQDFADLKTAAAVAQKNYDVELLNSHAALAEAKARQADLDLAKQRLLDTTVRAPRQEGPEIPAAVAAAVPREDLQERSYAIAQRMISVGTYVKDDTPLFRLIDDDPVKMQAYVPEKHVAEIHVGQKVRVTVEAYSQEFWGQVSRVNPQVDPANRTFQIEVIIPNGKRLLKPGGFAKASVQTQKDPNVIFAPQRAVVSFAGVSKVYVIRNGKAAEVVVETGQKQDDYVEITKGLKGDEAVIVSGPNRLANGVPVDLSDKAASDKAAGEANAIYNQRVGS